jgi:hypothetical protein
LVSERRFPPPWSIEEQPACFVVRDHNGQKLAYESRIYVGFGSEADIDRRLIHVRFTPESGHRW